MTHLFSDISAALKDIGDGWTSDAKAHAMAATVIAIRPAISLEIGVYAGKGLVSLALAHKAIGQGIAIGVDPWSPAESTKGQVNPQDVAFWSDTDHEHIYRKCLDMVNRWAVHDHVRIIRSRSDDYLPPANIGLLRIDGNHGQQALADIKRYAPAVATGGILFLDDVEWAGGSVKQGYEWLKAQPQWRELYQLDDGTTFQRQ